MSFATRAVELGDVAEDLLSYLEGLLPSMAAMLVAVPLEGGAAMRFVATRGAHVPLLHTVEPAGKGVLGHAVTQGEPARQDSGDEGGAWYEHELGESRFAAPVTLDKELVAAVAVFGPFGSIDSNVETAVHRACSEASMAMAAARRVSEVEAELEAARRLLAAVGELVEERTPEAVVQTALRGAMEVCPGDTASVMLVDPATRTLTIAAATHLPEDVVESTRVPLGEGISGWVAQCGAGTVINDTNDRRSAAVRPTRSAVCVPMVSDAGALFGVLNVGSTKTQGLFSEVDVGRLSTYGGYVARALVAAGAKGLKR